MQDDIVARTKKRPEFISKTGVIEAFNGRGASSLWLLEPKCSSWLLAVLVRSKNVSDAPKNTGGYADKGAEFLKNRGFLSATT